MVCKHVSNNNNNNNDNDNNGYSAHGSVLKTSS